MECKRILKPVDLNYKIICAGSGFDIGKGMPVSVSFGGRSYGAKMHKEIKGRIDGLSRLYADFPFTEGQELLLSYDAATNTIEISDLSGTNPTDDSADDWLDDDLQDSETGGKKEYSQSEIYDIFYGMDSVVCHQEYYSNPQPHRAAVNRGWIVYGGGGWGDEYCLMNEDTLEKIPLKVSGHQSDVFLGANCGGLWFMKYNAKNKNGDAAAGSLVFTGPFFGDETVMRFNAKKAMISTPYIHRLQAYYIAYVSENRQSLMTVGFGGSEEELFIAHKGESISALSVGDNLIVFQLRSDDSPEKNGWYALDRNSSRPPVFLNGARKEGSPYLPAIEIHRIFLDKKVMWTEVTESEAARFGIGRNCWICRSLGEPKEGRFRVYKDTGKPVVWQMPSFPRLDYFDGKVAYSAPGYSVLKRLKPDGSEITLFSGGHGECDKIVVSDKYLYGNFDAIVPVRVPRLFRQPEETGCLAVRDFETGDLTIRNPEAEAIWGTKDIRF